ncbi:hypothetical protein MSPP1_001840 [Malassezia sp. CBS 17886]|nr:hypothetical protein MSPP1_001840 [Malassezia sp. CBS 17886]
MERMHTNAAEAAKRAAGEGGGAQGERPPRPARSGSRATPVPAVVLTPPDVGDARFGETSGTAPSPPGAHAAMWTDDAAPRVPPRSENADPASPATHTPPKSAVLVPQMPVCADPAQADGALAKLARMERMRASKHVALRWTGVDSARAVVEKMGPAESAGERAAGKEHALVAPLVQEYDRTQQHVALPTINVLSRNGTPSNGGETPSLSASATPSPAPTLPPSPDRGAERTTAPTEDPLPLHAPRPVAGAAGFPDASDSCPRVFPPALLTHDWADSDSHESVPSDLGSSEEGSVSADESAVEDAANASRLSLEHTDVLTNKQVDTQLRRMRRLPDELREPGEAPPAGGRRHRLAQHLPYAGARHRAPRAVQRPAFARAVQKQAPAHASLLGNASSATLLSRTSSPDASPHAARAPRPPSRARPSPTPLSTHEPSPSQTPSPPVPAGSPGAVDDGSDVAAAERPHVWQRRRRKAWDNAPADGGCGDGDMDTLALLGPPCAAAAASKCTGVAPCAGDTPCATTKHTTEYVCDILHENERGIVLFGVSKRFSSNVLFFWDPSPWTDGHGDNTALTTATMQVPDPTWEWVHDKWLVDMTDDTDEDGWQYSGGFGARTGKHAPGCLARRVRKYMRARAQGHADDCAQNQGMAEDQVDRGGVEASLRSARAGVHRWRGIPGLLSFVRRRRWVRMRRRLVPVPAAPAGTAAGDDPTAASLQAGAVPATDESSDGDDEATTSPRYARDVALAERRLHMLMPLFLLPPVQATAMLRARSDGIRLYETEAWIRHFMCLLSQDMQVLNPFINWAWVQYALDRSDLAFATSALRAQERHAQRRGAPATDACAGRAAYMLYYASHLSPDGTRVPRQSIVREAIVAMSLGRVVQVMRLCPLDRVRLALWRQWLGRGDAAPPEGRDPCARRDLCATLATVQQDWTRLRTRPYLRERTAPVFPHSVERYLRARLHEYTRRATMILDVWDVLLVHLPTIVAMLDHGSSQCEFLALVRAVQETDFHVYPGAADASACPFPDDPRWRVVGPNTRRLPALPYALAQHCHVT